MIAVVPVLPLKGKAALMEGNRDLLRLRKGNRSRFPAVVNQPAPPGGGARRKLIEPTKEETNEEG